MSVLADWEIKKLAEEEEMISPFQGSLVSETNGRKILSYGLSSYGYDIRLSPKQCLIFGKIQSKQKIKVNKIWQKNRYHSIID